MGAATGVRQVLATRLPPLFGKLQAAGVLPSPFRPGAHIAFADAARHARVREVGSHRPPAPLASFVRAAPDLRSLATLALFADADQRFAEPVRFGIIEAEAARVWTRFGVHDAKAGSFADVYCSIEALANPKYEVPRLLLPLVPPRRHVPRAVFLGMAWWHNHYHWLIDILPRLRLVQEQLGEGIPLLVPPNLRRAQREALDAVLAVLGCADAAVLTPDGSVLLADTLIMPTRMAHTLDMGPAQIDVLRAALLPNSGGPSGRRLYISRRDAAIRRIVNEEELFSHLVPLGFELTTLSGLTMRQQAMLFAEAEIVVGHHGAGLANTLFCPRGGVFVEVFQENHFTSCFARIAQLRGLRYGFVTGEQRGQDTVVNAALVTRLIADLLAADGQDGPGAGNGSDASALP
ncbi:glycosyltransferase family 61 protein [Erythrobacteraceae bacterium CFH 75059]|uniref:glycosyltransferase family 61 protein n=1 Tax=Qipengyuania thermophila TaxID=2509361 RepID=UPI0010226F0C|nr:glycosyltransferase family 61 protein [Qipengyuania thermophila]TCD05006.1 glycosyltransferase family 61 protein [Erythrobacteraceae bacterium CFH 75059]